MKLSKLVLSNFQCFSEQPEIIELENDISVLIGLNGTGKTATLILGGLLLLKRVASHFFHY